jgi:hypothetical protein
VVHCLRQRLREPGNVDSDVLLPQVEVVEREPALAMDGIGVRDRRVIPSENTRQGALVQADEVVDVLEPHVGRRLVVLDPRHVLQLPERHYLDHHPARRHEHLGRQPRAVDAQEHVERVQRPRLLLDGHVAPQLHHLRLEPRRPRRPHDLLLVRELAVVAPVEQHQPRLRLRLPGEDGRLVAREVEGLALEPGEVGHGEALLQLGHDGELLVNVEPHGEVAEASHVRVLVQVHHVVPGQAPEEGPVLARPRGPLAEVGDQELDLAAVPPRRHEQRHQHVGVVVEDVARQPAQREQDARHGVRRRAARGAGLVRKLRDGHLIDGVHVPARVRPDLPLLPLLGRPAGRDEGHPPGRAVDAYVAADLAGFGEAARRARHCRAIICCTPKKRNFIRRLCMSASPNCKQHGISILVG